jgi:molybdenum cofactor cytidylyltransferase
MINKYGIIILAAGSSSRLGRPKQLLPYKGQSLLRHIVDIAIAAELGPVIVVIGAELKLLEDELKNTKAIIVLNKEWEEGIASSIRNGLNQFTVQFPSAEGVIFTVCDQPYITELLFARIS